MVGMAGVRPDGARPRSPAGEFDTWRVRRAWWIPDVALVASCVTLFYCLFLFQGYQKLFRDSDAGWHIRTGETVLATGTFPRSDPYSFTKAGQPWYAWEWGADVLSGAAHRAWGLSGVAMLYGVAIGVGVWLWFGLNWAVGGNFLLACALAIPLLSTCNIHWLARPHVLSWLFLLATVLCAERVELPRFRTIAVASAIWTNVHATFFLGPGILAIYAFSHFLRPLIWDFDRYAEWKRARWFGGATAIAALATLANPYGWGVHRHVFAYVTDGELLHRVGEFQSFDFQAAGAGQILLAVLVAAAGAVLALGRRNPAHFLLGALVVAGGLRSARGLPLVALLGLPIANGAITAALEDWRGLRPSLRRRLDAFLEYSARLRGFDARFSGWAWAPLAIVAMFFLLRTPGITARTGFPSDTFPLQAATEVEKLPAGIRLLAPDKFGGYLIYRFNGRLKVFFDGRSDFYGTSFLKDYARMVQVRPGWQDVFRRYEFTHALLPNDYSLIPALEGLGWRVIYSDATATLLAKPNEIAGEPCGADDRFLSSAPVVRPRGQTTKNDRLPHGVNEWIGRKSS